MTDWFAPLNNLTPPDEDVVWSRCRVGHRRHTRTTVRPDPSLFADMRPSLTVYDWRRYGGEQLDKWAEYCPAQDVISQAIDKRGVWERNESLLFVDILKSGDPSSQVVIDFGCQIGWYSTIAAAYRYPVAAIDVNAENLSVAEDNISAVATAEFSLHLGTVDEHAPTLSPDMPVRCVKVDIEGAEPHAIAMLAPTLAAGNVDYLLVEVSPVFHDAYPAMMEQLMDWGYMPHLVPGRDATPSFARDPLGVVLTVFPIRRVADWLANLHQADVLFARKDLT